MSTPKKFDFAQFNDDEMQLLRAARRLFEAMEAEPARREEAAHKEWKTKISQEAVR